VSLDASALVQLLQPQTGAIDPATGAPAPEPTPALTNYAKGYIAMLQGAIVAAPLPTGLGSAPPGGPVAGGALTGGKFLAVVSATMAGIASEGAVPTALPGLLLECSAIAAYLMSAALINFSAGTVVGNSTATPTSPGPLAAGGASGGAISGLSGSSLASLVSAATLQSGPLQTGFYSALCDYTMSAGLAAFPTGLVQGVCTPSGQLTAGFSPGGGTVT
jgi:hypothetical protein